MTTLNLPALRQFALAATPGERRHAPEDRSPNYDRIYVGQLHGPGQTIAQWVLERDARFIAALSPDVVIGLLDRIEHLETKVQSLRDGRLRRQARIAALESECEWCREPEATVAEPVSSVVEPEATVEHVEPEYLTWDARQGWFNPLANTELAVAGTDAPPLPLKSPPPEWED